MSSARPAPETRPRTDRAARSGLLFAVVATVLFASAGAVAGDALRSVTPMQAAQARAIVAAAGLLPFAMARVGPRRALALWRTHGGALVALGIVMAAVHLTYYVAIERLGVGPGITIQFLAPLLVLAWMRSVQHRAVSPVAWGAAALAVVGIGLIAGVGSGIAADPVGIGAGLAAAVAFAAYLLLGERLGHEMEPSLLLGWAFLVAAIVWSVLQPPWRFPTDLTPIVWVELVWLGIGGTLLAFMCELAALRRLTAGAVGIVATLEPAIAAAIAWSWLGQRLTVGQAVGIALVVVAVAVAQRATDRPEHLFEPPLDVAR